MNIDRILSRFKRNGYNVTRCASGKIMVKQPNGFSELFDSYNAAYEHYFCYIKKVRTGISVTSLSFCKRSIISKLQ